MSADSEVAVCNRGLQKIGERQIMSLDDKSQQATECKRLYSILRDRIQGEYAWNFCKTRASLPALADAPAFGFSKQFNLPTDFLRLLDVRTSSKWSLEGGKILTDSGSPLEIIYVARVTDTTKFSPEFTEVFASLIAVELVEIFTQSNQKKQLLLEQYELQLRKGLATDAKQQHPMEFEEDDWITSRW